MWHEGAECAAWFSLFVSFWVILCVALRFCCNFMEWLPKECFLCRFQRRM
jgi:hypothetical protein